MQHFSKTLFKIKTLETIPTLKFHTTTSNSKENLAAVLYGVNDLRLEKRPIPKIKDHQVLLRMGVVGICGSDVHFLVAGRIGKFIVKEPMVIGHEAAGTVVEVGKDVCNLKVGDRVAVEPGEPCRMCKYCKIGKYNLCPSMVFCATPPNHGNLTNFYAHCADFCFKLPDHVSLEKGALLEPLSIGVRSCKRGKVTIGSKVLVLGAGPIGLVTLLSAKAYGASKVVIIDLKKTRLCKAEELGADITILSDEKSNEKDITSKILEAFCGEPDVTIDCVGTEQTVRTAILATAVGGTAVISGMGGDEIKIPLMSALIKEVDLKGIFRYVNDYEDALELVASGKVDPIPLVTHNFDMKDTLKAFETAKTGEGDPIKVLIHVESKDSNSCR